MTAACLPPSVRRDDSADAGRCRAHDVSAAFDGSELRDLCVHVRPGRGSEPGVVGAHDENLGVALHLGVGEIGECRLPADERGDGERAGGIDAVSPSRRQTAVERADVGQPREERSARKPFGKGHELALLINLRTAVGEKI